MSIFGGYAYYYDFLNNDKDYATETIFIQDLLKRYRNNSTCILELGCGTGGHAECLAKAGFNVCGIDRSNDMLKQAEVRRSRLPSELHSKMNFKQGDIRSIRLEKKFDVVLSLFHVLSYQISNEDLLSAFMTAREHLNDGGILIFDCWYGPAVLTDRPEVRIKRWKNNRISVLRFADPVMHPNDNTVDVNYQIIVKKDNNNLCEEFYETHRMRYLFRPEIEHFLSQTGFEILDFKEWLTGNEASFGSWNVYFAAMRLSQ